MEKIQTYISGVFYSLPVQLLLLHFKKYQVEQYKWIGIKWFGSDDERIENDPAYQHQYKTNNEGPGTTESGDTIS